MGASCGMKTVAWTPTSRAAHATAWPWLPALAATTPTARSAAESVASLFMAPRTLNEPVRCRFSALSRTSRPVSRESVAEPYTGVTRACSWIRSRAASMSASVGAVFVAKVEDLVKDRTHRAQRVELSPLDLLEQAGELGILGDGRLEVPTRTRRRDGEDLGGEVAAPALFETARDAVRLDCVPELADPDPRERVGEDHRRPGGFAWPEGEHLPHVGRRRARERVLALVDRDHVRDLHDARLQRLHGVSGAR